MGLKLTLNKENNDFYFDFVNAYWSIDHIDYTPNKCNFTLIAYPSREAKKAYGELVQSLMISQEQDQTTIGYSIHSSTINAGIYKWNASFDLSDIFSDNIPLNPNEQKTILYNFVKSYTGLPFEDVFETSQV